jgi:hypothetical protein
LDFFNLLVILTLIVDGQSGGKHHGTPTNYPIGENNHIPTN